MSLDLVLLSNILSKILQFTTTLINTVQVSSLTASLLLVPLIVYSHGLPSVNQKLIRSRGQRRAGIVIDLPQLRTENSHLKGNATHFNNLRMSLPCPRTKLLPETEALNCTIHYPRSTAKISTSHFTDLRFSS